MSVYEIRHFCSQSNVAYSNIFVLHSIIEAFVKRNRVMFTSFNACLFVNILLMNTQAIVGKSCSDFAVMFSVILLRSLMIYSAVVTIETR